ncbi:Dolichyl-phosphate-mannose-protein mannosyltransferase [Robiginitalea myxolifaciens]|uniref:Dolichyl-phosphate-mannose-protein mannosyltransferase n=1 Tax=Robiginitalea myxolifaciens TaxID=400055 RepID=A0A1I6H129_9FLAO|nr:phospholipid carrier-dependent glycosyltransferase [Robiginitalea myxolifaciens]SFR48031.1 Dolichyl-phosphate-mannose-protein mannosyltransferase [Robiginitalea myxolifaciens]
MQKVFSRQTFTSNPRLWQGLTLLGVLLFTIWRSSYGTRLDSFANDEPFHIISGAYYAETGDYRLNPEHPPLSKLWVGHWIKNDMELRPLEVLNDKEHERHWLQEIMYYENDDIGIQRKSRAAMYAFHFILGLCIAGLLWRFFGFQWALISMLWLALEPSISSHQPLVLTDLPLSLTLVLSALTAGKLAMTWKWEWVVAFGLAVGSAMAVKHSALPAIAGIGLLLLGFALIPLVKKSWKEAGSRLVRILGASIIGLGVLWAAYGFSYEGSIEGKDQFNRSLELKISDLNKPIYRNLVTFMDNSRLFPKAYLWGFADTIRAGMEGRGDDEHKFFGEVVMGRAPYLYFPAVLLVRIPLALQLVLLLGLGVLIYCAIKARKGEGSFTKEQWVIIAFVGTLVIMHVLALASGRTSYGGVRHAMPITAGLGILAGASAFLGLPRLGIRNRLIPYGLLLITFVMTVTEKRIYEYHNEIVGGTENAYKFFANEGLYLGQRFYEIRDFFDGIHVDSTENIQSWSWLMKEEVNASKLDVERGIVKDIFDDSNSEGKVKGYFIIESWLYHPWPNWDPARLDALKTVKRLGNISIAYGELADPENWAFSMSGKVFEYLAETREPDWDLVRRRMEKVVEIMPWRSSDNTVLGNAYLRLNQKENALAAYTRASENLASDDPYQELLKNQIETIRNATELSDIKTLRPAVLE